MDSYNQHFKSDGATDILSMVKEKDGEWVEYSEAQAEITRLRKALDGFIDYADNFYDHDVDSGYHHVQKLKKKALKEK